ncbi:MAG: hypothetical protein FWB88_02545 [Defluviitaleaceae bacterium]|nr:hypothetical protein [Defluviitaleaceae bacterium]
MIYKKVTEETLCPQLFANPTAEYRGAPFWAWNCKLEGAELARQIDIFKEMGLGGFFMHSRSGLATEYMGKEFLDMAELCNKKAIDNEMICYLYDEDRWPSGAAGGLVTKEHKHRLQMLVFCPVEYNFGETGFLPPQRHNVRHTASRTLLARYKVNLHDGDLLGYERVEEGEANFEAYLAVAGNDPWYNNEAYINTLDKNAVARFIELTHEKYKARLGDSFGKSVPAIFTDEPQFSFKQTFLRGADAQSVTIPFTVDFDQTYREAYGEGLLDSLPELFWEWQDKRPSRARYRYHDHVCERFTVAFSDQIGAWCEENGILLTGHMMEEFSLTAQTKAIGDCMRAYRSFQLPGIDMLCDYREYLTAKQAQSATHQYGRCGVMSELYGVTNWDFDFRGHKLQGDWQAALGVTLRVHHLSWVSMAGEAKRDYPASIGYQSPWFKEYSFVEDHFARVNTALVRGRPIVRIAVVHPVESLWMCFGPNDKTNPTRAELETQFTNLIEWLLFGQLDFDLISESLLPDLYKGTSGGKFNVGQMGYDTVIVPGCLSLRSTTLDALEGFSSGGGKVIFMGARPVWVDGEARDASAAVATATSIPFAKTALHQCLEAYREVGIMRTDGIRAERWIYQLRQDGNVKWLFICNGTKPQNQDIPIAEEVIITIKGRYTPVLFDTLTGKTAPMPVAHTNDSTLISRSLHMHDSLLIQLSPAAETHSFGKEVTEETAKETVLTPHAFTLSEPNVLLLDRAAYAFDDGPWQGTQRGEDILRIDNLFREKLDYPPRCNAKAQPWTIKAQGEIKHHLALRFSITAETALDEVWLALENPEKTQISWNGKDVPAVPVGYYVDRSIKKIPLPGLVMGDNELILRIPFNVATDVENCFLLGQFGVGLRGRETTVIPFPETLPFGDITAMGFPFYGGNVTYHCRVQTDGGPLHLQAAHFANPLLSVDVNGQRADVIAYAPYVLALGDLAPGSHDICLTAYGNRVNTFGTLHNANVTEKWFGPDAWRTTGAKWSDEYRVKATGILVSPRISRK